MEGTIWGTKPQDQVVVLSHCYTTVPEVTNRREYYSEYIPQNLSVERGQGVFGTATAALSQEIDNTWREVRPLEYSGILGIAESLHQESKIQKV